MKRVLLFLVLLGIGFLALRLALGDVSLATTGGSERTKATDRPAPPGDPIQIQQGNDPGIGVRVAGGFQVTQRRTIPTPTGSRFEDIYELRCEDCVPADGGRHLLSDVTVRIFDRDVHTANLTASQALVELDIGAGNSRSLRENREIELSDAILETVPGSRLGDVRMELGRVRVIVEDELMSLHTPDPNQPVAVIVAGERRGTLRGKGLRVRLPRDAERSSGRSSGRLDLVILHDPVIETGGLTVRASGNLHYVETLQTGAGLLTVDDDVRIDLEPGAQRRRGRGSVAGNEPVTLTGDQLHGWLRRSSKDAADPQSQDGLTWDLLRVTGSRARVQGAGLDLQSPRLTLVPGPTGDPFAITADGGQSNLTQVDDKGREVAFQTTRPVHLIQPDRWIGAVHRRFGFPALALRPLRDLEVVVFEGAAHLVAGDGVEVTTDRGLRVHRSRAVDDELHAFGLGNVRVAHGLGDERIVATCDHGFTLRRTAHGDELILGAPADTSEQRFELSRGAARLAGRGACRSWRTTDGVTHLSAASSDATLRADTGPFGAGVGDQGVLQNARTIDVQVRAGEVLSFVATGPDLRAEIRRDGLEVTVEAPRMEQLGKESWRLSMVADKLAQLSLPVSAARPGGTLRAPRIDIHRIAARAAVIDAHAAGEALARIMVTMPQATDSPGETVDVQARRLQLVPFAVGPLRVPMLLTGLPRAAALVATSTMSLPWLLATGEVVADSASTERGGFHGTGHRLLLATGSRSSLLIGDTESGELAVLENRQGPRRSVTAKGAAVRVFSGADPKSGPGERLTVLTHAPGSDRHVPPMTVLRDFSEGDDSPFANLLGTCAGEIEVTPGAVLFHGPVRAHSLRPSGDEDPKGMHVIAEQLTMTRNPLTGEIARVEAGGGVEVDWDRIHARSQKLEIDLRWQRLIAEGPPAALLRFDAGLVYRANRIEANYVTYALSNFQGSLLMEADPGRDR